MNTTVDEYIERIFCYPGYAQCVDVLKSDECIAKILLHSDFESYCNVIETVSSVELRYDGGLNKAWKCVNDASKSERKLPVDKLSIKFSACDSESLKNFLFDLASPPEDGDNGWQNYTPVVDILCVLCMALPTSNIDAVGNISTELRNWLKCFTCYQNRSESKEQAFRCFCQYIDSKNQDNRVGFVKLMEMALANDATAMACVSICYEKGYGVEADAKKAAEWWKLAYVERLGLQR